MYASRTLALLTVLALCTCATAATGLQLAQDSVYCLSQGDFTQADTPLGGIYISAVPSEAACRITYGARTLRAGDVLPQSALGALEIRPTSDVKLDCALVYRPITEQGVGLPQQLSFTLTGSQNTAPIAQDGTLETYKNIAVTGTCTARDAENDPLTYQLVRKPRRGSVELQSDGTFCYTPNENKVGKDSFTFTATDPAGNVSEAATIQIRIRKPTDAATYDDLRGARCEHAAMWLKETGALSGRTIAGRLCFCPDEPIARGEFLAAAMHVLGLQPESAAVTTGFSDTQDAPAWMQPYITSALKLGVVGGSVTDDGLQFRPTAALTRAEAAVMTANLLRLPQDSATSVFASDSALPAWAASAATAIAQAGLTLDTTRSGELTRAEAAQLLYDAAHFRSTAP